MTKKLSNPLLFIKEYVNEHEDEINKYCFNEIEKMVYTLRDKYEQHEEYNIKLDSNGRIFLSGSSDIELKMDPLHKTLYLFLLRHNNDGIKRNDLIDYEDEIYTIYHTLRSNGYYSFGQYIYKKNEKWLKKVKSICDPLYNDGDVNMWTSHLSQIISKTRAEIMKSVNFNKKVAAQYSIPPKKFSLPFDASHKLICEQGWFGSDFFQNVG